ncbi:MAG TPA: GH92 family glycosyl hydrolase [Puia sp.]|uniref:GH92 family glycosyl hydrolase n=1 Tax=Puia sp. TaxID=2045100 RepID=UPI002CE66085|nr:GH92 family glycosyl hydrolase [Puia sp.]HVU94339.1 GH92 family glycosyl hydrolase [Puia sp.]
MNKILFPVLMLSALSSFAQDKPAEDLNKYVNPMIGTQRMGHTYPGATVPFGAVQLSPDTDTLSYEVNGRYNKSIYQYCAGYQYDDKTIVGFSHTHFSGTGHSDLGDFLIMPTVGQLRLNPGTASQPRSGYRSTYSHQTEVAQPDYYKVRLDDYNILAELTTSTRVGFHQYTFPKSDSAHIILDLIAGIYNYPEKNVWTYVRVENDTLITGFRQTNGMARTRFVYFAMVLSKPFYEYGNENASKKQLYHGFWGKWDQRKNFPEIAGSRIRLYFNYRTQEGEKIRIKFALSPVSTDNALENLRTEIPGWDFEKVKTDGQADWNKELSRVLVQTTSEGERTAFYTSLYHAFISPTIYMDVDGQYRGIDQNNHKADGFVHYTTFSFWDTYRALHPLFNILQPHRTSDMIRTMLAHYDQSVHKMLPIWPNYANENWSMIGYHSVSVIADAVIKGNANFHLNHALDACVATARHRSYEGLGYYLQLGYVPDDKSGVSVSETLEYAYDDWCVAQLAKKLNRMDIYEEFYKRSLNYKNVYDPSTGYMRPKRSDGTFRKDFDVMETNGQGFVEGNAWNESLYVPQDPAEMIRMMGGNKRFVPHLDSLFTMDLPDKYFAETEDITRDGLIGNYVHGNEPSHHIAYLYDWTDQPWKTQQRVRMILKKMYLPTPDGLSGNDDCGQMSAWYIFSALGFYPVAPGSDQYALGSPSVKNATLNLENGKTFVVEAIDQSDKNVYVRKALLNGRPLDRRYITHDEIMAGGKIIFYMSDKPNKKV